MAGKSFSKFQLQTNLYSNFACLTILSTTPPTLFSLFDLTGEDRVKRRNSFSSPAGVFPNCNISTSVIENIALQGMSNQKFPFFIFSTSSFGNSNVVTQQQL